jgi:hypothetical protein
VDRGPPGEPHGGVPRPRATLRGLGCLRRGRKVAGPQGGHRVRRGRVLVLPVHVRGRAAHGGDGDAWPLPPGALLVASARGGHEQSPHGSLPGRVTTPVHLRDGAPDAEGRKARRDRRGGDPATQPDHRVPLREPDGGRIRPGQLHRIPREVRRGARPEHVAGTSG